MEDFISSKNIGIINIACRNMISDKFKIELGDNEISNIVNEIVDAMYDEYQTDGLNTKELNNIALGRVKDMISNRPSQETENKASETKLDDDLINIKLQELESRRKAIPEFTENIEHSTVQKERHDNIIYKPNPISITVPKNKKNNFKTLMINSINRDWLKQPIRNNIKFGMSLDTNNNMFYPHCLCLPKFVKNITPYVLVTISDGTKSIYYSFTTEGNDPSGKWDVWKTVESPENISLSGKIWSLKLLDFTNNELKLGEDDCKITQAVQNEQNELCLKYDKPTGSNIAIRMKNNQMIYKTISHSDDYTFVIQDEYDITDFIEAKILNIDEQFSFIMKYCYKQD